MPCDAVTNSASPNDRSGHEATSESFRPSRLSIGEVIRTPLPGLAQARATRFWLRVLIGVARGRIIEVRAPVARDFEIGQEIGLRGTPGILLANGELMPGYMSPAMLVKKLQPLGR